MSRTSSDSSSDSSSIASTIKYNNFRFFTFNSNSNFEHEINRAIKIAYHSLHKLKDELKNTQPIRSYRLSEIIGGFKRKKLNE